MGVILTFPNALYKAHCQQRANASAHQLEAIFLKFRNFIDLFIRTFARGALSHRPDRKCKKNSGGKGGVPGGPYPQNFGCPPKREFSIVRSIKNVFGRKKNFLAIMTPAVGLNGADTSSVEIWFPVSQAIRKLGGWNLLFRFRLCRTTNLANMVQISANLRYLGTTKQARSWRLSR